MIMAKISFMKVRMSWSWLFRSLVAFIALFLFYLFFLNYTEPTHVGIARNHISGQVWIQKGGGWYVTAPWVCVVKIDTRPMRVVLPSSGKGFSAKLVQFNPKYWKEFIATEGFHYYWWYNRISFNLGYHEESRGFRDIMRGYAYCANKYPFIVILQEYRSQ